MLPEKLPRTSSYPFIYLDPVFRCWVLDLRLLESELGGPGTQGAWEPLAEPIIKA